MNRHRTGSPLWDFTDDPSWHMPEVLRHWIVAHGVQVAHHASFVPADFRVNRVLDLGCGKGELARWLYSPFLVPHKMNYLGLDKDFNAVSRAIGHSGRKRYTHFIHADLRELVENEATWPSLRSDVVVCSDILEHLPRDIVPALLLRISSVSPVLLGTVAGSGSRSGIKHENGMHHADLFDMIRKGGWEVKHLSYLSSPVSEDHMLASAWIPNEMTSNLLGMQDEVSPVRTVGPRFFFVAWSKKYMIEVKRVKRS